MTQRNSLETGNLRDAIRSTAARALRSGALEPIATECTYLEQAGIRYQVRILGKIQRKEANRRDSGAHGQSFNPFLPHDPELFVSSISDTHNGLLNKFNVLDEHLLIVTRAFRPQEMLLDETDFDACLQCLGQIEGLVFYNGGKVAGASQEHKHLQMVPLPLGEGAYSVPLAPRFQVVGKHHGSIYQANLDFAHRMTVLEPNRSTASGLEQLYLDMLGSVGIEPIPHGGTPRQPFPYNLLLARRWMLVVPRRAEHWEGLSVNSLGFAGALLVRDHEGFEKLRRVGPAAVLRMVSGYPTE